MTLEEFKTAALATGYKFERFTPVGFLSSFTAEIPSKRHYVGLFFPNIYGGVTLVKGWGPKKEIKFYGSIRDIKKEVYA